MTAASVRRAGFTMLELMLGLGLFAVVAVNATLLLRATERSRAQSGDLVQLEVLANQTLDRIALALMAAQQEVITPLNPAPLHSPSIDYTVTLGVEDGEIVLGDPERIELDLDELVVRWLKNPNGPEQARVVWGRHVARAALGETLEDADDDNGNDLYDEYGLSFHLDDESRSVLIQLSLAKTSSSGELIETMAETRVAFRN